jgi:hypothetical protein
MPNILIRHRPEISPSTEAARSFSEIVQTAWQLDDADIGVIWCPYTPWCTGTKMLDLEVEALPGPDNQRAVRAPAMAKALHDAACAVLIDQSLPADVGVFVKIFASGAYYTK